jgi:hypothetical protein
VSTRHPTQTWFVVSQTVPPLVPPPASTAASLGASPAASLAPSVPASSAASLAASPAASLAPASGRATQSRFDLQPGAHAVPAQYSPVGQLSFDGKHWTQVSFIVSHQGVAPWHCELTVHCTHDCAMHCSPVGQGCVALHPGTHALVLQTVPAAQSLLVRQATQVSLVVLHLPVGAVQSVSSRHVTHAFVVVSQTLPVGQWLIASHPMAHALFTHRCPEPQSAEVRHATHDVCASHFCPAGQSAFTPQTWQVPLTQTWPFVLEAQSAFDWQPPMLVGPSFDGAASAFAASSPGTEASPPPGPMMALPPPEQPVGKNNVDASNVTKANPTTRRRSLPITAKLSRLPAE